MKHLLASLLMLCAAGTAHAAPTVIKTTITTQQARVPLTLELATTPAQRERGLMYRKTLAPHDGMLFAFPQVAPQKFWMKDTLIPLDMLFIDPQHRIVHILTAAAQSETPVGPDVAVNVVIELDGGRAAREGIAVGDKVAYDIPADIEIR